MRDSYQGKERFFFGVCVLSTRKVTFLDEHSMIFFPDFFFASFCLAVPNDDNKCALCSFFLPPFLSNERSEGGGEREGCRGKEEGRCRVSSYRVCHKKMHLS